MKNKLTIVEFYSEISTILELYRNSRVSYTSAISKINLLNNQAVESNLDISIDASKILQNIEDFDDERSFEEEVSYESSYEDD